jgi:SAM-dependent methyltransferase
MPIARVSMPLYLPAWLHGALKRAKHAMISSSARGNGINLSGDRDVEWTFIGSRLPSGPGEALDFGCASGYLSLLAARKGFRVTAVDLLDQSFSWLEPNVRFLRGDVMQIGLPRNHFDLIINCSSVEHVGLPGRYDISQGDADGDLQVMRRFLELLKPNGTLLATVPCGRDVVAASWHRVYGVERLPRLMQGYTIAKQEFWIKDNQNLWVKTNRQAALDFVPTVHPTSPHLCTYALGCFVLTKSGATQGASETT